MYLSVFYTVERLLSQALFRAPMGNLSELLATSSVAECPSVSSGESKLGYALQ